jgi:hypothetical protein
VAIGWCAALDLIHMVSYKGMDLLPQADANMPTQFWIAARFIQAVALLSSPLFLRRAARIKSLHFGYGLAALGAAAWIFSGYFPVMFVEGQGLTPFKIYAEYVIIAMLLAAGVLYWRNRRLMLPSLFLSMQLALVAMILGLPSPVMPTSMVCRMSWAMFKIFVTGSWPGPGAEHLARTPACCRFGQYLRKS